MQWDQAELLFLRPHVPTLLVWIQSWVSILSLAGEMWAAEQDLEWVLDAGLPPR